MKIALDLDDVILDFCTGLRHAVKTEYGVDVEFDSWDLNHTLNPVLGKSWWKWMRERDWLWSNFPAVQGAIGGIDILRQQGHYLEIVTSKPKWAEYSVWKWLGKWRPSVHRVTIVGTDDKKSDYTDARVLVDDKPDNCRDFLDAGRSAILFDRPHNQHSQKGFIIARNWAEVVEQLTGGPE